MLMPKRSTAGAFGYRYGFNGKENDNEVKGLGNQQDYGMRIYDNRLGRFLSVDPLVCSYPYYSPYQFAGNMPIAAIDLDGAEVEVRFKKGEIWEKSAKIEITTEVSIKIQVINLSAIPDKEIDLQNIALNLELDLHNKLNGSATSIMKMPYDFIIKGRVVEGISEMPANPQKPYQVTYSTRVFVDVSVASDMSKIESDSRVFALVDFVNDRKDMDRAGVATLGGNVAIGEVQYFVKGADIEQGKKLALHEFLHQLGATDTYPPNSGLPGTQNKDNAMYSLIPNSKRNLTDIQIVHEIWQNTIGPPTYIFQKGEYQQPKSEDKRSTQEQLKKIINENGHGCVQLISAT